ncbi:MAG: PIN domain-containing protein [Gammaproteobacteria bacterium]|nr:PIN domain-containing protein [Gammaproteobacteria bacterium]
MIAIDTNLLVYAHRPEMPFHQRAREVLSGAVAGAEPVSVPWPCVHEFLAVVSNPRIFRDPTPVDVALDAAGRLLDSLDGGFLAEGEGYLGVLDRIARTAHLQGAVVHDARIAALCLYHGVRLLWSADRDFSRFPDLAVTNPLPAG